MSLHLFHEMLFPETSEFFQKDVECSPVSKVLIGLRLVICLCLDLDGKAPYKSCLCIMYVTKQRLCMRLRLKDISHMPGQGAQPSGGLEH